ncbi:MAG: DUF885 domain-containing protein [Pseudomonadota bacterium]
MRHARPLLLCLALASVTALGACAAAPTEPAPPAVAAAPATASPSQLFADYWEESLALNPLSATYVGDARYNDRLPNFLGAEERAKQLAFALKWRARVAAIHTSALDTQDSLSVQMLLRALDLNIEGERFPAHLQPINQFYSLPNQLAQLGSGTSAQPFKTVADYDNWARRAALIPPLFTQAIANMREGVAKGVVQPKVLMEKVLPQLDALILDDPKQTLFYKPIGKFPESFSAEDKARLTAEYTTLIRDTLMPAYKGMRNYIRDEYLPKTRSTVGLGALPDGPAWYAYRAKSSTTTTLTPTEIHQIGLDEVARIHGAMRKIITELKFKGDLQAFFKFLDSDKRFEFKDEAALLSFYESLRKKVDPAAGKLFSLQPKAAFEIRPVETFRNKSAAGGSYQAPSEDGTRAGVFYVNTYDLPSRKTWDAEDLYLHEAVPGHHFQIALAQELTGLPKFRRLGGGITAYSEGWGLYAESLGKELGVYQDPYDYFGYLQNELWRAIRLVVDTGLHDKGWSRQQVIDYMLANSAQSETQAISEAERYMAIPGQALAYKIGELRIKALRLRAENALGAKFDIRAFHAEVLKDGAVPLDVLEAKIDRWIAATLKSS